LPNRYSLVGGGSFLKLLIFLKMLYLKKCTIGQVSRNISPPLDKIYVLENNWKLKEKPISGESEKVNELR